MVYPLQLTEIRSKELTQQEKAVEEKTKAIAAIQGNIETEKAKQRKLEKELEDIRALQPKVCGGRPCMGVLSHDLCTGHMIFTTILDIKLGLSYAGVSHDCHMTLQVSRVTQLKEQLKELDEKVNSEEKKLTSLKTSSQRSQHVVSREFKATQRKM